jgi:ubiquinone/menaquinone biosynthesis C-methylase UbiE
MDKELDSKIYDRGILNQGMQFQIDNYYQPKEISMIRRVNIVLKELNIIGGEKILDIGCGVGTFAFHTAKKGAISFGIDYSYQSIKMAVKLCTKFNIKGKSYFLVSNAFNLPFRDNSFDKIVASDFIEHITYKGKDKFLREVYRLLKPTGLVVIFTPNGIRERIGEIYWRVRHCLWGNEIPVAPLHYGLTTRGEFECLLKNYKFSFRLIYRDVMRPCLAKIPLLRKFLALNLLWILKKI